MQSLPAVVGVRRVARPQIPGPLLGVLAEALAVVYSHAQIDSLFVQCGAPDTSPGGSKPTKTLHWLRDVNQLADDPMAIAGLLMQEIMEIDPASSRYSFSQPYREKLEGALARRELAYVYGGKLVHRASAAAPARSLETVIRDRDMPSLHEEFQRALGSVETKPRDAASAAANILESLLKIYIEDEDLEMPAKKDLQSVWPMVRKNLGLDPSLLEDDDLKKVLSGMISVVDGIASFRTHASTAHAQGRKRYALQSRHARLVVNAASTVAAFILETWDQRRRT